MTHANGRTNGAVRTAMPDEAEAQLMAYRDTLSGNEWDAAELLESLERELGRTFKRKRAGDLLGVLPSTVGAWILAAKHCAEYRRKAKFEVLSFSHFVYAARSDDPHALLTRAVESADEFGGSPAPVRVLREWLAEERGKQRKEKPTSFTGTVVSCGGGPDTFLLCIRCDSESPQPTVRSEVIVTLMEESE